LAISKNKESEVQGIGKKKGIFWLLYAYERGGGMDRDRYESGLKKLGEVDGEGGAKVIENLKDISPDVGRYLIEFPFGDVYSCPALDLKSREIAYGRCSDNSWSCPRPVKIPSPRGLKRWVHPPRGD
jgi:hypothetical protein